MTSKHHSYLQIFAFIVLASAGCKKNAVVSDSLSIAGFYPPMAGSGDTITVLGSGFSPNAQSNELLVGGAPAQIVEASTQKIKAIVPQAASKKGKISITVAGASSEANETFSTLTVVSGNLSGNLGWRADQNYLLRGAVQLSSGSTLTIEPGTVIFGEKKSTGSLTVANGATLTAMGTADKPIVFTSDQKNGFRAPGDWLGIQLQQTENQENDVLQYIRIEFAGNHLPNVPIGALIVERGLAAGSFDHVQISYSASDGLRLQGPSPNRRYMKYIFALGCAGNDFSFSDAASASAQFVLGLKDVRYTDPLSSDGLLVQSSADVVFSNLTLVGYDAFARGEAGLKGVGAISGFSQTADSNVPYSKNAGSGVHIGGLANDGKRLLNGYLTLANSLIAAAWRAGIAVDGSVAWGEFEGDSPATLSSIVENCIITKTPAINASSIGDDGKLPAENLIPNRGGPFARENYSGFGLGFDAITATAQYAKFVLKNPGYSRRLNLSGKKTFAGTSGFYDDLGIQNFVDSKNLTLGDIVPASGSLLFVGANFETGSLYDNNFFEKVTFRGCANSNWIVGWASVTPFSNSYD